MAVSDATKWILIIMTVFVIIIIVYIIYLILLPIILFIRYINYLGTTRRESMKDRLSKGMYGGVPVYFYRQEDRADAPLWMMEEGEIYLPNSKAWYRDTVGITGRPL